MTGNVMLAWCTAGEVRNEFATSVVALDRYARVGQIVSLITGPRIAEARNQLVDAFATTDLDWLWFVDADMVFTADALERLLATANPATRPIVGALCFTADEQPTMFRLTSKELESERITEWEPDSVVEVDATGTGCLLIHRQVFVAMQRKFGRLANGAENPYPWFVEGMASPKGEAFGEDTAFCIRAKSLGFPIHVDTSVRIGHVKTRVVGEVS